jgi:DNA-binding NtrC family response regulator
MPFRLVGRVGEKTVSLLLPEGASVVGSASDAAARLDHPTVSRSHALLRVSGERVELRDLDSRNGTFVGEDRITEAVLSPGASVAFGHVRLMLEQVDETDLSPGFSFHDAPPVARREPASPFSTVRTKPVETFTIEKLPGLLHLVAEGADETRLAQAGGAALFETLPLLAVEVAVPGEGERGLLFRADRPLEGVQGTPLTAGDEELELRVTFPEPSGLETYRPIVESVATLLRLSLKRKPARARPAPAAPSPPEPPSIVAEVQRLYEDAARVSRGDIGVLVCGESGTGKEILARYVHAASPRAQGPFVALNCAALPRDLLETELFGIEKGVATGVDARPGKFELAHGGTLFLDEIGDMALETQAKILRVLQEGAVHRLGAVAARKADVRIVAATNRDMDRLLAERAFREDVYYRIATWTVRLPPLRERRADIPNLAAHFLAREAERAGVRARGISRAALDALARYDWPGNIRQLEKEMARAVLFLADGELLDTSRLSPQVRQPTGEPGTGTGTRLADILERAEREEIVAALARCGGDVEKAAEVLDLGRSTLYRRMKALGIEP